MNKKQKTPEYTRRAIEKYHLKFARFTISTPHEIKDRLTAVLGPKESANGLINELLLREIERRETGQAAHDPEQIARPDSLK